MPDPSRLTYGSVVSFTAAPPGYTALVGWPTDAERDRGTYRGQECPVIGWAVILADSGTDEVESTRLEPVFIYDGRVTYYTDLGPRDGWPLHVTVTSPEK